MSDFDNISGTGWVVLFISIGAPTIFFIAVLIHMMAFGPSSEETFLELHKQIEVHGRIDRFYNDVANHYARTMVVGDVKLHISANWDQYFAVGDSLAKNRGEVILQVFKPDTMLILDYHDYQSLLKKKLIKLLLCY